MVRKQHLDRLHEDGYRAALAGQPCDASVTRSLERAAWENGWRSGHREALAHMRAVDTFADHYRIRKEGK